MKPLLTVSLLLLLALILAGPLVYFLTASRLPDLATEFDLERQLKAQVLSDQRGAQQRQLTHGPLRDWVRPELGSLPRELVALYLMHWGCPFYLESPPEEGLAWSWRLFSGLAFGASPEGDAACERAFALQLARGIGIQDELSQTVAAARLHRALNKGELLAWSIASPRFEPGVRGARAAAVKLLGRPLDELSLSDLAELSLALPPNGFYGELRRCTQPALLRRARNASLEGAGQLQLIGVDRVREAQGRPLGCHRRVR